MGERVGTCLGLLAAGARMREDGFREVEIRGGGGELGEEHAEGTRGGCIPLPRIFMEKGGVRGPCWARGRRNRTNAKTAK